MRVDIETCTNIELLRREALRLEQVIEANANRSEDQDAEIKALSTKVREQEWRSVNDELPNIEGGVQAFVLVRDEDDEVEACTYWHPEAGKPHFAYSKRGAYDGVRITHWKTIEPTQEGKGETDADK